MTGWPISNPMRTLPTTPSPRMCWRRSVNAWTGDLSDAERREIVQLLVRRITVHTTLPDSGRKQVQVVIDYRFPPVVQTRTDIAASSQLQSPPHYRRLIESPLTTDRIQLQGQAPVSPSSSFPSLILHGGNSARPGNAPLCNRPRVFSASRPVCGLWRAGRLPDLALRLRPTTLGKGVLS